MAYRFDFLPFEAYFKYLCELYLVVQKKILKMQSIAFLMPKSHKKQQNERNTSIIT